MASDSKVLAYNAEDPGLIPGLGRSPGVGNGKPTPVFLPGNYGWRSLVGYSPRGCKESDMTEWLHFHFPKDHHSFGDVLQDWRPFHFTSHCLSLSILPFYFSSSLLLSLWSLKETSTQTPRRWLFWCTSLPSWSADSPTSLFLASTPHFSDSLAYRVMNRVSLDSVTISSKQSVATEWNIILT